MPQKLIPKLLICLSAMFLASCVATTPEIRTEVKIVDTSCNWVKPITISFNDNLTDITARQILAYNRLVKKNCPGK